MVVLILKFQERCADETCRQVAASASVKPYQVHYKKKISFVLYSIVSILK